MYQTMRAKMRPARIPIVAMLVFVALLGVVVAVFLTQTIPQTTVPAATVSSPCTALSTTSTITATVGAVQYTCSGTAAFTSLAGSSSYILTGYIQCPATVTSPCYSNFGYVAHGDTTTCVAGATIGPSFHPIAGVTPPTITFTAGSWDYCAFYAAPSTGGTLPSFSIGWS